MVFDEAVAGGLQPAPNTTWDQASLLWRAAYPRFGLVSPTRPGQRFDVSTSEELTPVFGYTIFNKPEYTSDPCGCQGGSLGLAGSSSGGRLGQDFLCAAAGAFAGRA